MQPLGQHYAGVGSSAMDREFKPSGLKTEGAKPVDLGTVGYKTLPSVRQTGPKYPTIRIDDGYKSSFSLNHKFNHYDRRILTLT
jgi:hypothetical protein